MYIQEGETVRYLNDGIEKITSYYLLPTIKFISVGGEDISFKFILFLFLSYKWKILLKDTCNIYKYTQHAAAVTTSCHRYKPSSKFLDNALSIEMEKINSSIQSELIVLNSINKKRKEVQKKLDIIKEELMR